MDKLFGDLKGFFKTGKCVIDSFIFRLHYRFTLVTLIAFSIAVTGRQYIGDPIDCISKDDIPTELLDTYCWIHTTFSVESAWFKEIGKEIPYPGVDKHTPGEKRVYHAYYQWVCFVLFLQAMLFYIPRYLWKNIESHKMQNLVMKFSSPVVSAERKWEEVEIEVLVDKKETFRLKKPKQTLADETELVDNEGTLPLVKKTKIERELVDGEDLVLLEEDAKDDETELVDDEGTYLLEKQTKKVKKIKKMEWVDNEDTVLLVTYLFENRKNHYFYVMSYYATQLLNFINVVGQIFLMDVFLGGEFTTYGTKVLAFSEWDYSLRYDPMIRVFPRMTKCTFHRYGSSGDVQKHDAMCLIPINILNEKIYIFLWFWFIILATLTGLELLYRGTAIVFSGFRRNVLRTKCRKVCADDLDLVMAHTDKYDWVVMNMLCDNVTPNNYKIIFRDLAKKMREELPSSERFRSERKWEEDRRRMESEDSKNKLQAKITAKEHLKKEIEKKLEEDRKRMESEYSKDKFGEQFDKKMREDDPLLSEKQVMFP